MNDRATEIMAWVVSETVAGEAGVVHVFPYDPTGLKDARALFDQIARDNKALDIWEEDGEACAGFEDDWGVSLERSAVARDHRYHQLRKEEENHGN